MACTKLDWNHMAGWPLNDVPVILFNERSGVDERKSLLYQALNGQPKCPQIELEFNSIQLYISRVGSSTFPMSIPDAPTAHSGNSNILFWLRPHISMCCIDSTSDSNAEHSELMQLINRTDIELLLFCCHSMCSKREIMSSLPFCIGGTRIKRLRQRGGEGDKQTRESWIWKTEKKRSERSTRT